MNITVVGSEGFIAQHVIKKLLELGHTVAGIDCMDEQAHKDNPNFSPDRSFYNDVRGYRVMWARAGDCSPNKPEDAIIHLGAKVGVGQSMYQIEDYVHMNTMDTARFLQRLSKVPPKRLVVASSMSVYGEGGNEPVREDRPVDLRSIYALTKYDQEQMCLIWGKAYKVPTVALRFFNTYGPGQSLNNPYTGVMAIFASRLLNGNPPVIYGDGTQARDFIHVDDVANAVVHAATKDIASGVYNVGTANATPISEVARRLRNHLNPGVEITYTGPREGDIQRCIANVGKIIASGWWPNIDFARGLNTYCEWLLTQPKPVDRFEVAHKELVAHGLTD